MKKYIIILSVLVTACVYYPEVNQEHINKAGELCSTNQGIGEITKAEVSSTGLTYSMVVKCVNGAKFDWIWLKK